MKFLAFFTVTLLCLTSFAVTQMDRSVCQPKRISGESIEICHTPLYGDSWGEKELNLDTNIGYRRYSNFQCGVTVHFIVPDDINKKVSAETDLEFLQTLEPIFGIQFASKYNPQNLVWLPISEIMFEKPNEIKNHLNEAPDCLNQAFQFLLKNANNNLSPQQHPPLAGTMKAAFTFYVRLMQTQVGLIKANEQQNASVNF